MSRDLGRHVPDLEKLDARKLWADFSFPEIGTSEKKKGRVGTILEMLWTSILLCSPEPGGLAAVRKPGIPELALRVFPGCFGTSGSASGNSQPY